MSLDSAAKDNLPTKKKFSMAELKSKLKKEFKEHGTRDILITIGTLYVAGLIGQGFRAFTRLPDIVAGTIEKSEVFTFNPLTSIWTAVSTVPGILSLLLTIAIVWVGWFYGIKPRMKEVTGYEDDRNFRIAEEGTYGTSSFMKEDEIERVLDIKPIGEQEGNIIGLYGDKAISIPSKREFEEKAKKYNWGIEERVNNQISNNNIVAIGAPGTMKTRAFVRNLIIQAAKREESLIITDPKGELVEDTAVYLQNKGYKVRIFNLVNLLCSDSWDCIATIGTDSIVAKIFADTIANSAGAGDNKYWIDNASIIFKAVSLYVIESPAEVNKTMGRVYDILSTYDLPTLDGLFCTLPENSVARRAYNSFKRCNENVKGQILNGISTMLSVFQDDIVRDITNHNEIDVEGICYEKCAYFLIMSDQHDSFDFLATLFYAMSFVKQVEAIDRERSKREAGKEYRKTIPINYIMDEFSNLGQIPNFEKKISTLRSRQINLVLIIQNIPQLKNRYPDDRWQEILGCCAVTVCLGSTDKMSAEYISSFTGIATIEVESVNSTYDRQVVLLNQETEYKEVRSRGQRQLMNLDEILRMPNMEEIIFIRGQNPLQCKKFDYTLNPESKKFVKCSVTDHKPQWLLEKEAKRAENEAKVAELRARAAESDQIAIKKVELNARNGKYPNNNAAQASQAPQVQQQNTTVQSPNAQPAYPNAGVSPNATANVGVKVEQKTLSVPYNPSPVASVSSSSPTPTAAYTQKVQNDSIPGQTGQKAEQSKKVEAKPPEKTLKSSQLDNFANTFFGDMDLEKLKSPSLQNGAGGAKRSGGFAVGNVGTEKSTVADGEDDCPERDLSMRETSDEKDDE